MNFKAHPKYKQPWNNRWNACKDRCINPKSAYYYRYGGRDIKFDLGFWEMGVLWWRDKANLMDKPSIDRIDNDGDYVYSNCRFIELAENIRRAFIGKKFSKEHRENLSKAGIGNKNAIGGNNRKREEI